MNLNDKEFVLCSKHCHLERERLRKGKKKVKKLLSKLVGI